MSDSDFSDVDDAPPQASSLTSAASVRIVLDGSSTATLLYARLGGPLYPWVPVQQDAPTTIYRRGNTAKPRAADGRLESHLEFTVNPRSPDTQSHVLIDVLSEEEPAAPLKKRSADGALAVTVIWVVGERVGHPNLQRPLVASPPPPAPQTAPAAEPSPTATLPAPQIAPPPRFSLHDDHSSGSTRATLPHPTEAAVPPSTHTKKHDVHHVAHETVPQKPDEAAGSLLAKPSTEQPQQQQAPAAPRQQLERQPVTRVEEQRPITVTELHQQPAPPSGASQEQRQSASAAAPPPQSQMADAHPLEEQPQPPPSYPVQSAPRTGEQGNAPPCYYLHAVILCVSDVPGREPNSFVKLSVGVTTLPPLVVTSHVVRRSKNPWFRAASDIFLAIPKDLYASDCELSVAVALMEKKLVSADTTLANGTLALRASQCAVDPLDPLVLAVPCGADTVATVQLFLTSTPNAPATRVHPLMASALQDSIDGDSEAVLELEIVRAEMRKEEAPIGSYFAQVSVSSGKSEISNERTVATLVENGCPLWRHVSHVLVKSVAVAVDVTVSQMNSLKKTETPIGVVPRFFVRCCPSLEWTTMELGLGCPAADAVKKEKSSDVGRLFVRYRLVPKKAILAELEQKKQRYQEPLYPDDDADNDDDGAAADHQEDVTDLSTRPPTLLSKYSVAVSVFRCEGMLVSTPKDRFEDAQLSIQYAGSPPLLSNVVPLAHPGADAFDPVYTLELRMEPTKKLQQFVVTHQVASAKGGKILGRGVLDVDVPSLQEGVATLFPVVLEPRTDGDAKELAEDVALLNRAGRLHFGTVTLSVTVQRFVYWSSSSVLTISDLRLHSALPNVPLSSYQIAMWFRDHPNFTIPRENVVLLPLRDDGAAQISLAKLPTIFPLDSKGRLAPLCVALLDASRSAPLPPTQIDTLEKTLLSLVLAAQTQVHEVTGLGERSAEEIAVHIRNIAAAEIVKHVNGYIELDLTSSLMEAAAFAHRLAERRGSCVVTGHAPLDHNFSVEMKAAWMDVARPLRRSSIPKKRVHGFDILSERLWVVKATAVLQHSGIQGPPPHSGEQPQRLNDSTKPKKKGVVPASLQISAREVQSPPVPVEPRVERVDVDLELEPPPPLGVESDPRNDVRVVFVFGGAHSSRTDLCLVERTTGASAVVKADMLLRTGGSPCVLVESRPLPGTLLTISYLWCHGNRGLTESEESSRRKALEAHWRAAQVEPEQRPVIATVLNKTDDSSHLRVCGCTLTRCGGNVAFLVGGMDETSRPLNRIFVYQIRERKWAEWSPLWTVRTSEEDDRKRLQHRQPTSFEVNPRTIQQHATMASSSDVPATASSTTEPMRITKPSPTFSARQGHTATFCAVLGKLILYGGIGPDGFDPACVSEDGYCHGVGTHSRRLNSSGRTTSARRHRPPPPSRYGYLSDVWALDVKKSGLECCDMITTADGALHTEHHHDARWRHSAVCSDKSMFVVGGKTVVVKSVTVPYEMGTRASSAHANTTYYTAEEVVCPCEYISVLDLATWTWSAVHTSGMVPAARYGHSSCLHGNQVYVVGGRGSPAELFHDLYVLDLNSLRWSEVLPFGKSVPRPLELASLLAVTVEGRPLLVVVGGRNQLTLPGESPVPDKLVIHYFNLETLFWHTMPFECPSGQRRIMPGVCDVTVTHPSSALKRLPFQFTPVLQLLMVGGDRGVDVDSATSTNSGTLISAEESEMFDGRCARPRPCAAAVVLNVALQPRDIVQRQARAPHIEEDVLCHHLRFRDAAIPGWALEKSVNRLSTRPASPSPALPSSAKDAKARAKLASASEMNRVNAQLYYHPVDAKRSATEERRRLEEEEARARFTKLQGKLGMDAANQQLYYQAVEHKRSTREEQEQAAEEKLPARGPKFQSVDDQARSNERLYYKPVKDRHEMSKAQRDELEALQQSQRQLTLREQEESLARLHRGPPSPLSSQKYGPKGTSAYTPAQRR